MTLCRALIRTSCLLLILSESCLSFVSHSFGKDYEIMPEKALQPLMMDQQNSELKIGKEDFDRRSFISFLVSSIAPAMLHPAISNAVEVQLAQQEPPITHKVTFNVRVSRADGTFYTRNDDAPPTPDNQVFTGSVSVGLYGTLCPNHVKHFLDYVDVPYSPADDAPLPSYARSQFPSLDQATGTLSGGLIPGLHLTSFTGSSAIEYGGRILPAKLWVDEFKNKQKISHSRAGLLTHRDLDVLPKFGITTRSCPEMNFGNTVFGTVLPSESSNAFLSRCVDLPTYSLDRPVVPVGKTQSLATEEVASSVYSLQKDFFRAAAKTFGDTRLDNVYEGKLLRRIEVTSVKSEKL